MEADEEAMSAVTEANEVALGQAAVAMWGTWATGANEEGVGAGVASGIE